MEELHRPTPADFSVFKNKNVDNIRVGDNTVINVIYLDTLSWAGDREEKEAWRQNLSDWKINDGLVNGWDWPKWFRKSKKQQKPYETKTQTQESSWAFKTEEGRWEVERTDTNIDTVKGDKSFTVIVLLKAVFTHVNLQELSQNATMTLTTCLFISQQKKRNDAKRSSF